MPDYSNRICAECIFRGVDVALYANDEAIITCKSCTLDFPPDDSSRCGSNRDDADCSGEEGNNANLE